MMITGGTATTYAGTAATADACSTACSLITNCAAADFNTAGSVCRHFITTNGNLPSKACFATTASNTYTAYSKPCSEYTYLIMDFGHAQCIEIYILNGLSTVRITGTLIKNLLKVDKAA